MDQAKITELQIRNGEWVATLSCEKTLGADDFDCDLIGMVSMTQDYTDGEFLVWLVEPTELKVGDSITTEGEVIEGADRKDAEVVEIPENDNYTTAEAWAEKFNGR